MPATMTLLLGIPASGKTTWARRHPGLGILLSDIRPCPDWWQRERQRRHLAATHLAAMRSIVVDGCNLSDSVRRDWRRTAHRNRAACHLIVFDTPVDEALARNRRRPRRISDQAMADYVARWPGAVATALAERWHHMVTVRTVDHGEPDQCPDNAPDVVEGGHRWSTDW